MIRIIAPHPLNTLDHHQIVSDSTPRYEIKPRDFLDRHAVEPDRYCSDCAKAARLALAAESAPRPLSRCTTLGCGSYAINPGQSWRDKTSDLNLCDVCYWRKRAESANWPKPRSISEAPKDKRILAWEIFLSKGLGWIVVSWDDYEARWVDSSGVFCNVTHFLPLPPEVR